MPPKKQSGKLKAGAIIQSASGMGRLEVAAMNVLYVTSDDEVVVELTRKDHTGMTASLGTLEDFVEILQDNGYSIRRQVPDPEDEG